jgi:uncharacterized protein YbaR (Trm112 family)
MMLFPLINPRSVGKLACPNCKKKLKLQKNSMTFKNPFFALFEGHVIHAASKKLQEKYNK